MSEIKPESRWSDFKKFIGYAASIGAVVVPAAFYAQPDAHADNPDVTPTPILNTNLSSDSINVDYEPKDYRTVDDQPAHLNFTLRNTQGNIVDTFSNVPGPGKIAGQGSESVFAIRLIDRVHIFDYQNNGQTRTEIPVSDFEPGVTYFPASINQTGPHTYMLAMGAKNSSYQISQQFFSIDAARGTEMLLDLKNRVLLPAIITGR